MDVKPKLTHLIFIAVFLIVPFVNAENPEVVWKKHFTGEIKGYDRKNIMINCPISKVSLSQDGKLVGYQKNTDYYDTVCSSKFLVIEEGSETEIGDFSDNVVGFVWSNNYLVSIKDSLSTKKEVLFYSYIKSNISIVNRLKTSDIFTLSSFEVSPNGKYFAIVDAYKTIILFDINSNVSTEIDYQSQRRISSISLSNNGDLAVFAKDEYGGELILFTSSGTQQFQKEFDVHDGIARISPNGERIILGLYNLVKSLKGLHFIDRKGNELWSINLWKEGLKNGPLNDLKVSYDGEYLIYVAHDEIIEIISQNGTLVGNYSTTTTGPLLKTAENIAISEKGDYILVSTAGGYLHYLDNRANLKDSLIILANSIDYDLNLGLFEFLKTKGFKITITTADEFQRYRNEKSIIILGGPDAPEGTGEIVKEVLMNSEQNELRETGSRKIYFKTNVWSQGQKIIIIGGSDRRETKQAVDENKDQINTK